MRYIGERPFGLKSVEQEALVEALHQWECLQCSLFSGRKHRRSTLQKLAELNLVVKHPAVRVDGDGFILYPERYGHAWMLTVHGLDVAQRLKKMQLDKCRKGPTT